MMVHILRHGFALCGLAGLPRDWPVGHRWVAYNDPTMPSEANCPACIEPAVTATMRESRADLCAICSKELVNNRCTLEWANGYHPDSPRGLTVADRPLVAPGTAAWSERLTTMQAEYEAYSEDPFLEVRYDDNKEFDDFVARNAFVRLERMDAGHWWMRVQAPTGEAVVINLFTGRPSTTKINGRAEHEPAPKPK